MITDEQRREMVRRAILDFLAPRQALSFDPVIIRERLTASRALDFNPTDEDVFSAISFLVGLDYLRQRNSSLGATIFYQATSAGVLAFERGTLCSET